MAAAKLLYFAALRDAAGRDGEHVELAPGATLRSVYDDARARHGFAWSTAQLRVAVDGAFARWDDAAQDGSEIAIIPPVSGG